MTQLTTHLASPHARTPFRRLGSQIKRSYVIRTAVRYLSNPRWLSMYALGRFGPARAIAARFSPRPAHGAESASLIFPELNADQIAARLQSDGYCPGLTLPRAMVDEIQHFARTQTCYPDRNPQTRFVISDRARAEREIEESILIGRFQNSAQRCPAIAALQNDPLLRAVAAKHLGARPIHLGNRLWWSFVNQASELQRVRAGQGFHYDLDDWRNVTFFFYLTDVDQSAGPHVMVRGSHTRKPLRWLMSIYKSRDEAQIVQQYGAERIVELTGPAGFGFAEDLFCYHKGSPPLNRDRLVLQIRFGLHDYGNANDMMA